MHALTRSLRGRIVGAAMLATLAASPTYGDVPQEAEPASDASVESEDRDPTMLAVAASLALARSPTAPDREGLVAAIAKLGDAAIPRLVEILVTRIVPAEGGEGQRMNVHQEEVLFAALAQLGARKGLLLLEAHHARLDDARVQRALLKAYGALGTHADLRRVIVLGTPPDREPADVDGELRTAVASLLARDPRTQPALEHAWRALPAAVVPALVFALGDSGDGRVLELFGETLAREPDLMPLIAAQIPRVGRSPRSEVNLDVAQTLRGGADTAPEQLQASILRALAALEDPHAATLCVDGLKSEDAGVRSASLWSIERLSQRRLGGDEASWSAWLAAETSWFESRFSECADALQSRDVSRASQAVRELATHPLYRNEIAREVATILDRAQPALRILGCRALAELGSRDVLRRLVEALGDEDPAVAQAAGDALRKITGSSLASNREAWEPMLDDRMP